MKIVALCIAVALASPVEAKVALSKVFTPHMVLQRDMAVPIYGTADPGEKVGLTFRDQAKSATAGADGQWRVTLDPLKAGGPDVLVIGDQKIEDVLVGDVWVGSGQSNMAMNVSAYVAGDPVLAAAAQATYPRIRLLKSGKNEAWQEATPEHIAKFSALLFSFGFPLYSQLDVPIGLMVGAVGGTPSGHWLSEEMLRSDAACREAAAQFAASPAYEAMINQHAKAVAKFELDQAAWQALDEAAKQDPKKRPRAPQPLGKAGEGNKGKIGHLFEAHIRPYVGYGIKGVLWDQGESRTAIIGVDQVTLMGALIGGWRKAWGQGDFPFLYVQKPSGGGCAFDESQPMNRLAEKFAPLPASIPGGPGGDYSHEVFARLMKYPATHMVTSSDLGAGIHPANKSGYGARAVQVALATAYGHNIEYLGPCYASHTIQGDKVTLKFTHTGKGLAAKNGAALQGFMIAGDDQKFGWADAQIHGDTIVVSSPAVARPAAVRYAWSNAFPWANLFNRDGIPAQPFRTDAW